MSGDLSRQPDERTGRRHESVGLVATDAVLAERLRQKALDRRRWAIAVLAASALVLLVSCSSVGYYTQAVVGGATILAKRTPIDQVLERSDLDPELRRRLELVHQVLDFAHQDLELPDNGSYRSYVELKSDAVVWNVVAAPRLSLEPVTWCFPFAGCVTYRGYFSQTRAERFAAKLERRGYDVKVRGAAAYSTLGWFRDPVISTFLVGDDWQIATFLIHELAHQRFYLPGDTELNESFATFIEELGLRRLAARGVAGADSHELGISVEAMERAKRREQAFLDLVLAYRSRLADLYAEDQSEVGKLRGKEAIFDQLRADYRELSSGWEGGPTYDGWFASDLNNADLVTVADYHRLVPGLEALYRQVGDLSAFYQLVEQLGALPFDQRREKLAAAESEMLFGGSDSAGQ